VGAVVISEGPQPFEVDGAADEEGGHPESAQSHHGVEAERVPNAVGEDRRRRDDGGVQAESDRAAAIWNM
jgi:hypothetical protein